MEKKNFLKNFFFFKFPEQIFNLFQIHCSMLGFFFSPLRSRSHGCDIDLETLASESKPTEKLLVCGGREQNGSSLGMSLALLVEKKKKS